MQRPTRQGSLDSLRLAAIVLLAFGFSSPADATIQFAQATAEVSEAQGSITVCLTRTGNDPDPEWYAIAVNGSATGTDFTQTWINMYTDWAPLPGSSNVMLRVNIAANDGTEGDETFEIVMIARSGSTFITGSPDRIRITIHDGGTPGPGATACAGGSPTPTPTPSPTPTPPAGSIRLERVSYVASEGAGTLIARAVRTGNLTVPQNVTITTLPRTAARPADYNHGPFFDLPWPAGASSVDFPITIVGDSVAEDNETFDISLSAGTLTGSPSQAEVTIVDDDPPAQLPTCGGDATTLALNDDRFHFTVSWRDFQGNTGVGYAERLTSDTGYFWFFDRDNVEVMVKALDARVINQNFWVFAGALSNVEYTLSVTDTATGAVRTYVNPSGTFASFGDTAAFPGIAVSDACPPFTPPLPLQGCDPAGNALCLNAADRFRVTVNWRGFQSQTGSGRSVDLTRDSGYFWFFSPENVELIVKVLDARAINGRFWVFYGALTNVEYDIRITDTVTGASKVYHNPLGQFGSFGDTEAF